MGQACPCTSFVIAATGDKPQQAGANPSEGAPRAPKCASPRKSASLRKSASPRLNQSQKSRNSETELQSASAALTLAANGAQMPAASAVETPAASTVETVAANASQMSAASASKPLAAIDKMKAHEGQYRANLNVKSGGFTLGSVAGTSTGRVQDHYAVDSKKIGEGGFGSVRIGVHKSTGTVRAIKSIALSAVPDPALLRDEIEIMRLLDHPHIVRLYEVFEDKCWVYLAMELCNGGELFAQIVKLKCFSEKNAGHCTKQMLLAINYLHQNRLMHRDLKPENFLLSDEGPLDKVTLKLIDFGFAKRFTSDPCTTCCGTLLYIAPEVLGGKYNQKADIWSLGVIVYLMLSGRLPWGNVHDEQSLMSLVKNGQVNFTPGSWTNISEGPRALVRLFLTKDVRSRPNALQALDNSWFTSDGPEEGQPALSADDLKQLRAFGRMHELKKAAVEVCVTQLPDSDISELRDVFMDMDMNKDGTLSFSEISKGLAQSGVKLPKNFEQLIKECDTDGSGVIDYTEFIAATLGKKLYHQKEVVWAAFTRFDLDNSGFIDRKELGKVLNDEVQEAMGIKGQAATAVQKAFDDTDTNQDGLIDFDEFFNMMVAVKGPARKSQKASPRLRAKKLKRAVSYVNEEPAAQA